MTAFLPAAARADNPIVQHIYTADPAPLVYNGRVYLYTGHDEDNSAPTSFTMREWRVSSSSDMVNWTDHGSPMSLATFSWASADAWAGQAVYRNGRFYWYVPVRMTNGSQAIGVGVSDSPTGPFRDALGGPLIQNSEIDPTVFIDDDGQAYLYYGNPNLWYLRLNADMISYSGSPTQIPLTTAGFGTRTGDANRPTLYEEGPTGRAAVSAGQVGVSSERCNSGGVSYRRPTESRPSKAMSNAWSAGFHRRVQRLRP
ncbi:family 43 glycosylhydrolase [Kitasatospora sp. NBC_00085]|uniref:family 43 glycosylhydrolase n=1 Tax=unclassified Kitasatospora TaxID=2633591 RepID=UPI0032517FFF